MNTKSEKRISVLLSLRRQDEELAIQAFAQAKATSETIRSRIAMLERCLSEHNRSVREALVGQAAASPEAHALLGRYRAALADIQHALDQETIRLMQAQDAVRLRQDEVLRALRDRKAVGNLAGTMRHRKAVLVARRETKEMDDVFAATHAAGEMR